MEPKDMLKALADEEGAKRDAAAFCDEMMTKVDEDVARSGGKKLPIDDAFMRRAIDAVFTGGKDAIESVKAKGREMEAVMFVFTGHEGKDGKLVAEVVRQGMGLTQDKNLIFDSVVKGVEESNGRLFVVLADEAWMFEADLKNPEEKELTAKIERGDISVSSIDKKYRQECLVINGVGLGVQYMMSSKVTRNPDGTRTVTRGRLMSTRDEGVKLGGRMSIKRKEGKE